MAPRATRERVLFGFTVAGLVVLACTAPRELAIDWSGVRGPDSACLDCHVDQGRDALAYGHHRDGEGGLGCLECHTPHPNRGEGPTQIVATCEQCHAEVMAEFRLPFSHPLPRDGGCLICHPPHGDAPRRLREQVREEACVGCHLEMRGPFLFVHEGDRNRACTSCHLPHGSPNRRLLTHADTRSLCMSCHVDLENSHVQNPGSVFRNCLRCHTEVHGSNWDREFFR